MPAPTETRFAETSAGRIAWTERGDGPAAVFVHGVYLNGALWNGVVERVSHARRCLCPDLLAHGATEERAGADLSFAGHAAALAEWLDALGLEQVDLVANDSGGGIAQILAARHPERIRSLALTNCDTHDGWPPPAFVPTVERMCGEDGPRILGALAESPALVRSAFGMGFEFPERLDDETIRSFMQPLVRDDARIAAVVETFRRMDCKDTVEVEPLLKKLDAPTLLFWGGADSFFGMEWARWLRDTLPNVTRVVEIPTGKLFLPFDRPAELAAELLLHWQPELRERLAAA